MHGHVLFQSKYYDNKESGQRYELINLPGQIYFLVTVSKRNFEMKEIIHITKFVICSCVISYRILFLTKDSTGFVQTR